MKKLGIKRWYSFVDAQIKVASQLSHFITDSQMSLREILEGFNLKAEQFKVIYCGVDQDIFKETREEPRHTSRILVINSGDTPLKGLRFLMEAVAELRKTREIELVIVGEPMHNGYTQGLMRSLKLEDCARYTGKIDTKELVNYYSSATMLVVPSQYEGFGLPAVEAMACGTPVISTTAGALPEVVGDAGILIPAGDTRAIIESVTALLDDENRRRELGEKGRQRVARLFNWDNTARETADYYKEAIDVQRSAKAV